MRRSMFASSLTASMVLLSACSTLPRTTVDTLRLAFAGKPRAEVTPAQVAARPYYQLQVDSPQGTVVLILGNVDHGRQAWYSSTSEIVFLRDGLVVKTSGLPSDVEATRLPADSPFRRGLQRLDGPTQSTRQVDLSRYRDGIVVESRLVPAGVEAVEILGTTHRLQRIDETLRAPALGYTATNRYWVDPADGFVWRSRQSIPGGQVLTLTVLRPYRAEAP